MVILSVELNRLLGHALADPALRARLLGEGRQALAIEYRLSPAEQDAVTGSPAQTLQELAADVCRLVGQPAPEPMCDVREMVRQLGIVPISSLALRAATQRVLAGLRAKTMDTAQLPAAEQQADSVLPCAPPFHPLHPDHTS